jgi:tetratricopeptide (TPR) repeat protein
LSQQVQSSPTNNHEAFDLYLRGHQLLEDFSSSSNQAAISYLERAVERDPSFALGYATLADAFLNMMNFYQIPQRDLLDAARKNAEIAVRLDSKLAEAQGSLAVVRQTLWDWRGAEQCFLEALRLKPAYATARRRYAGLLLQFGRFDEAVSMAREAYSQDPYDRGAAPGIGLYFFLAGRYDEAIRFLESVIGDRDMPFARHNLGDAYAEVAAHFQGPERDAYFAKALDQAAKVTAIESKEDSENGSYSPLGDEMYAHYYSLQLNYVAARPYFDRMLADMDTPRVSPAIVAWIYAVQGQKERALDLLERALSARDRKLFYIKQYPALASLRDEPRFKRILANMGLPDGGTNQN